MIKKFIFSSVLLFNIFSGIAQETSENIQQRLDTIWKSDQEIRFELIKLQQEGKMNSDEFRTLVKTMKKQDSANLDKVVSILENGWPDGLTMQGNQTLFLVIQHADLATQKEFLPVIEQAVNENKTLPGNLALLRDRIALREGKKQIYGSQVFIDSKTGKKYVEPIQNPEEVDSLRSEMGLPSMEVYLNQGFQMDWSLDKYYEDIKELKKVKENRS